MDSIERLELALDRVANLDALECEMKRLSRNRLEAVSKISLAVKKHRSLVDRKILSACILSETAVVGDDSTKVLRSCLHTQNDRAVHESNILRNIRKRYNAGVHRESYLNDVTLLPLAVERYISVRSCLS
jgi:hypothetical protein